MSPVVLVLGLLVAVLIGIAVAFVTSLRKSGAAPGGVDDRADLDPESRSIFSATRKLRDEIAALATSAGAGSAVSFVAQESRQEAERVADQVRRTLVVRQQLKKLMHGRSQLEIDRARLERQRDATSSEAERESINNALEANRSEMGHYQEIETQLGELDAAIRRAEAGLTELKARLAVGMSRDATAGSGSDGLRESLANLRALTISVDEAQALARDSVPSREG
jgi:chromosome segregation ATPase